MIIPTGTDPFNDERLHFAASAGDIDLVKELVAQGHDVNKRDADLHLTPLHYATRKGNTEVMVFLIRSGADVNDHDKAWAGETPLGEVSATCSLAVAKLLLKNGANPLIPGWMQITPLQRASQRCSAEGRKVHELMRHYACKTFGFRG